MLLRSWYIEIVVVATLLSAFNLLVDRPLLEWVGTIWALGSFFEWQLKHQKEPTSPEAENQLRRDYLRKEGLWVAYFTLLGVWSPIGIVLFLVYPYCKMVWVRRGKT